MGLWSRSKKSVDKVEEYVHESNLKSQGSPERYCRSDMYRSGESCELRLDSWTYSSTLSTDFLERDQRPIYSPKGFCQPRQAKGTTPQMLLDIRISSGMRSIGIGFLFNSSLPETDSTPTVSCKA